MKLPRIEYTDANGDQTLDFVLPPTSRPLLNLAAQRNDVFSTSGVRQCTTLRVDDSIPVELKCIEGFGADGDYVYQWQQFLAFATQGNTFTYYPDRLNTELSEQRFLVESNAQLAYSSPGVYSFKGTFQLEVPAGV